MSRSNRPFGRRREHGVDAEFGDPEADWVLAAVELHSPDHPSVGRHREPRMPEERVGDEDEVDRAGQPAEVPPVRSHRRDPIPLSAVVDLDDQRVLAGVEASGQLDRVGPEAAGVGGQFLAVEEHPARVVRGADVEEHPAGRHLVRCARRPCADTRRCPRSSAGVRPVCSSRPARSASARCRSRTPRDRPDVEACGLGRSRDRCAARGSRCSPSRTGRRSRSTRRRARCDARWSTFDIVVVPEFMERSWHAELHDRSAAAFRDLPPADAQDRGEPDARDAPRPRADRAPRPARAITRRGSASTTRPARS